MKFSHVPAYGFGKARKCEIERTDPLFTPGPGQYIPGIQGHHNPSWKIGTSIRKDLQPSDTPGPGQYAPDTNTNFIRPKTPSWKIGTGLRPDLNPVDKSVPGPGQYEPLYKSGAAKYSMRPKTTYGKRDVTPGPGNYNVRTDKNMIVPSYKFGNEKKDGLNLAQSRYVPGPGNYEYNADAINVNAPKFSFGKEVRGDNKRPKTPGPGQYSYKEYIGKEGPKITMSSKLAFDPRLGDNRFVPGPGMYNNTQSYIFNHNKAPSYKIGTSKRKGLYNTDGNPGPGQYSTANTNFYRPKTPSWKIGTGLRPDLNPVDKSVPGPGNYNVSQGLGKGPKYSIVGKGNTGNNKNGYPGPGQYNDTMYNKTSNPAWKIGTGNRDDNLKRVIREGVPGPGMYDYDKGSKGPKFKFGTEKRGAGIKSDTPGPGQYHIPCAIVDVNDYTREQGNFDPKYRYI